MKKQPYVKVARFTIGMLIAKVLVGVIVVVLVATWIIMRYLGGAFQAGNQALVIVKKSKEWHTVGPKGRLTPGLLDADYLLAGDMAMLSAIVYSGDTPLDHLPDYRQDIAKYAFERDELKARCWKRFSHSHRLVSPKGRTLMGGLVYDVWVNEDVAPVPLAVFVFRGTNDSPDWLANQPITHIRGMWTQYEQAESLTKKLSEELDHAYGNKVRIFTTGHSLGGGLAQYVRNHNLRIEKTFAFNSSPVTGDYTTSRKVRRFESEKRPVYIIYESNEILTAFRFIPIFFQRFASSRNTVMVRYNFSEKLTSHLPKSQHEMKRLVVGLTKN